MLLKMKSTKGRLSPVLSVAPTLRSLRQILWNLRRWKKDTRRKKKKKAKTVTTPRTWRHLRPAGLSLALVLCSTFSARTPLAAAQKQLKPNQPYALIFGTVWGPDDRPVFGVPVRIRRVQDKRARWELYSYRRREFAQRISAGKADYVVWADLTNFKSTDAKPL